MRPPRARSPRGSTRAPRARRSRRRPRSISERPAPSRSVTNASAVCTASRSPAIARARRAGVPRSSAGDLDLDRRRGAVGLRAQRAGRGRKVARRAAARAATPSSRGAVAAGVERRRAPPRARACGCRARASSAATFAVSVARTLSRPSVSASRVASIVPSATLTSPGDPPSAAAPARRRPDACSVLVAASEPGTILSRRLAVRRDRSALPRALA